MSNRIKAEDLVRKLQGERLETRALIDKVIDEESRTVQLAFSSEEPYERFWGIEILSHDRGAMNDERLRDGAPLLYNHNMNDLLGVVERIWIGDDRIGRAEVRFSKSALGDEKFRQVLEGVLRHVSVAYTIDEMVLQEQRDDGPDVYLVTKWTPYEVSMVTVPADHTVGVGRAMHSDDNIPEEESKMSENVKTNEPVAAPAPQVDVDAIRAEAAANERKRQAEINKLREQCVARGYDFADDLARQFIESGRSAEEFQRVVAERVLNSPLETVAANAEIGMTDKEVRRFSIVRLINALASPNDRAANEAAAFELEACRAAAEQMRKSPQGAILPADVLTRDLTVGTNSAGGYLKATELMPLIELLRNKAMTIQAGATVLSGLVGDIAIPKQSGGATAYWVAEGGAPTESAQALGQLSLKPKTVGAFTDISRKLLLQSSIDVEAFVRNDLAAVLALAIDDVAIEGGGTNQPTGILKTTGIGDVDGGANGAAPDWADIVDLETAVAVDNADVGTLAYMTNPKVRGVLKSTEKATGTAQFIWEGGEFPLNGYRAYVTNQVPSDLEDGTGTGLSAIIFGNWADLIIAMWGGLDIMVDPYSNSTSGTVRVVALQDVDIGLRHPESFAAMQDAIA